MNKIRIISVGSGVLAATFAICSILFEKERLVFQNLNVLFLSIMLLTNAFKEKDSPDQKEFRIGIIGGILVFICWIILLIILFYKYKI